MGKRNERGKVVEKRKEREISEYKKRDSYIRSRVCRLEGYNGMVKLKGRKRNGEEEEKEKRELSNDS